ncbi:MAG: DUF2752 domain-containing protein [Bacteroidota bacterium]|nr:DUF2752 domain-containing protein [Bacteroidota bacterium]
METSTPIKKPLPFRLADLRLEGLIVWTIITIITTSTLLLPFLTSPQFILQHTPVCISKQQFQVECAFCGMTRAFIEIAAGHFGRARELNDGSLLLYAGFFINSALYLSRGLPALWRITHNEAQSQP